jgi:hypothetical protein
LISLVHPIVGIEETSRRWYHPARVGHAALCWATRAGRSQMRAPDGTRTTVVQTVRVGGAATFAGEGGVCAQLGSEESARARRGCKIFMHVKRPGP